MIFPKDTKDELLCFFYVASQYLQVPMGLQGDRR